MKFLLYEIIPRAGFNLARGQFWPAGRMFDTPALENVGIHSDEAQQVGCLRG